MSDLVEFLLARIAEDEAASRAAVLVPFGKTSAEWEHADQTIRGKHDPVVLASRPEWTVGEHIARHDPARVLAECETKRALVALSQPDSVTEQLRVLAVANPAAWKLVGPLVDQADEEHVAVLRLLALPYADHLDYREEWRP